MSVKLRKKNLSGGKKSLYLDTLSSSGRALPRGQGELQREMTPERVFVVPEVLLSQAVPFEEVRMVPEPPTVTNVLFT